ncbi:BT1A1 protein, partial [Amia calva]|nr:BT1A1 protein [Amia calva]
FCPCCSLYYHSVLYSTLLSPAGKLNVAVPLGPLSINEGSNIVLPCHLKPEVSAVTMEVRWFREKFTDPVYVYNNGKFTEGSAYRGRATLFHQELIRGNVSLLLKNVRISDNGLYKCHVSSGQWYEEPPLHLLVRRQGTKPLIEVLKHERDSVKLRCSSEGWFPEPLMFWADKSGKNITADTKLAEKQAKDSPYSIASHIHIERSRNREGLDCVVIQQDQELQFESRVNINDEFFESTHPVRTYVSVTVIPIVLGLVCIMAAVIYHRNGRQDKSGKNITADTKLAEKQAKDSPYSIASHIHIERSRNREGLDCVVIQQDQELQFESRVNINVRTYVSVTVIPIVLGLVCIMAAVIYHRNGRQDLNPIEHLWDVLPKQVRSMEAPPRNLQDLKDLLLTSWCQIPQHTFRVDVTLDPETAQNRLRVSEDGKSVTLGERQSVSDNGRRFEQQFCVLGKTGFSSGRQYWEVTVGEKTDWYVGVTRESAKRDGNVALLPERGYWGLSLIDNKLNTSTQPVIPLPLSLKPQKVGVFVDCDEGQVSFYNVETRSHIYTFTITTEKKEVLYPCFGTFPPCKKTLTISPVNTMTSSNQSTGQAR